MIDDAKTWVTLMGLTYKDVSHLTDIPIKTIENWFQGYRLPPRYVGLYLLFVLEEGLHYV